MSKSAWRWDETAAVAAEAAEAVAADAISALASDEAGSVEAGGRKAEEASALLEITRVNAESAATLVLALSADSVTAKDNGSPLAIISEPNFPSPIKDPFDFERRMPISVK